MNFRFWKYLFFKYSRIGTFGDINAACFFTISFIFYFMSLWVLLDLFVFPQKMPPLPLWPVLIVILVIVIGLSVCFNSIVKNKKTMKNLENEFRESSNWPAFIFAAFSFLVWCLSIYLGLLRNQGKI